MSGHSSHVAGILAGMTIETFASIITGILGGSLIAVTIAYGDHMVAGLAGALRKRVGR